MSLQEAGIVGALGALLRLAWIFGIFPIMLSPEVKVSKWKGFYGRYVMLSYLAGIFMWKSYMWLSAPSHTILDVVGYTSLAIMTVITVISIWNAPGRTRKWLEGLRIVEKIIVRTKSVNRMEKKWTMITIGYLLIVLPGMASMTFWNSCIATNTCSLRGYFKVWTITFPSVINVNCMMFMFNLFALRIHVAALTLNKVIESLINSETDEKTEKRQILMNNYVSTITVYEDSSYVQMSQRIRDLAFNYMSLCVVIDTMLESVSSILMLIMFSGMMSLMTGTVIIVDLCLSSGPFPIQRFIMETVWCINVLIKTILLSEPCHLIHETMLETRELINQLRRKHSTDNKILNELRMFHVVTSLYRPTITPFNMYTLDRSLVAQISGCTITYFVAVMQLEVSELARQS